MFIRLRQSILKYLSSTSEFFFKIISAFAGLVAILAFLQSKNVNLLQAAANYISWITNFLQLGNIPLFVWAFMLVNIFVIWGLIKKIDLVAGEFRDNFDRGLLNWEYDGEGWSIERGERGCELSVTNSPDGGVTNFGFWDNYEFSFDCKIINNCVGWIVRAKDREHYVMIQLSTSKKSNPTINPHYRVPSGWWVQTTELKASEDIIKEVISNSWLSVKIVVFGNTINVFLDNERVLNHHIPDPVRLVTQKKYEWTGKPENETQTNKEVGLKQLESFSFPNGKVGFRCSGEEHAHIRNVRVKPLFWNCQVIH